MRIIKGISVLFLLVACSKVPLDQEIENSIARVESLNTRSSSKQQKTLMTYYLPMDIGVLESNKISSVLKYGNHEIFMSIHVSDVLKKDERSRMINDEIQNETIIEYAKDFSIRNDQDKQLEGKILLERLPKNKVLLYVNVDDVFFVSSLYEKDVGDVLERILLISKTMNVHKKAVISEFSNKESITFEKNVIELFTESIPDEGMIKDIITNDEEND